LNSIAILPPRAGRLVIAGVPEGFDAPFLARLARTAAATDAPAVHLHVALDDARMAQARCSSCPPG
jgi:hypothetical protein